MGTRIFRIGLVLVLFAVLGFMAPLAQAAPEAPPANDNFANAIEINGDSGSITGTSVAATKESGEPNHAGNAGGKSVWYKWVAPGSDKFLFRTSESAFDTLLAAYTGASVNALSEIASNDECSNQITSCLVLHANGGKTYWLAIDGYAGASGTINLEWVVPPPNNDFEDGAILGGLTGSVDGTLLNATKQAGEPNHSGSPGDASVWYQWTAPQVTRVRFLVTGYGDSLFGIYTGNNINALTKVSNGYDCGAAVGFAARCRVFDAVSGTTYHIAVDRSDQYLTDFSLRWGVPPTNDDFEHAAVISGTTGTVNGSNTNATAQPGEPTHNGSPPVYTVWYKWTAPSSGWIHFDTAGSASFMSVGVYTGSGLEELVEASNAVNCAGADRCTQFNAVSGTIYWLHLDSHFENALTLNWRPLMRPANDDFANAQVLDSNSGSVQGTTTDATKEAGEPDHGFEYGESSVWYKWMAPLNGRGRLDSVLDWTVLAVYTGNAVNALTLVNSAGENYILFDLVQGTTYAIAVDGRNATDSGPFTLSWNCPVTTKPELAQPANGSETRNPRVYLTWQYTDCASHYEVLVRQSSKKGPVVSQNKDLEQSSYTIPKLKVGYTYFWRVKACSAFQCTASKWRSFTIKK